MVKPFGDKLNSLTEEISASDDKLLSSCKDVTVISKRGGVTRDYKYGARPAPERLGEYTIGLPTRDPYFANSESAAACSTAAQQRALQLIPLFRRIQDVNRDRDDKLREHRESKQSEIAMLEQQFYLSYPRQANGQLRSAF